MAQAQITATVPELSYWDLAKELKDVDSTVAWCRGRGLLSTRHDCVCGSSCRLVKRSRYPGKCAYVVYQADPKLSIIEGIAWRCPRKGCQKIVSIRDSSFFSNSNLPITKILRILHLWSTKTPLGDMMKEVDIANQTAVDWYNFIRDVCCQYFIDNPVEIGGPGIEVEIDESKYGRRKYHRGRMVDGHWVFGGTERITGNSFLVEVSKRDAQTLIPIITKYIKPGSVIFSDEWRAYSGIPSLPGKNYTHHTVNHSQNFVNPATGAHTQSVESMWSSCKRMMRKTQTMWRKKFEGPHKNSFNNIIQCISEQYPVV